MRTFYGQSLLCTNKVTMIVFGGGFAGVVTVDFLWYKNIMP